MLALILTYHSHHVLSADYAENDHVALARDLEAIHRSGAKVVPLDELVDLVVEANPIRRMFYVRSRVVAITFDDGPEYDFRPMLHPQLGRFESFAHILTRFRASHREQNAAQATSFVIASPHARAVMERAFDRNYTYVGSGAMNQDWWNEAIDSGLIAIGNHSWDHLHPDLDRVAHSRQVRADFAQVDNATDANAQIADACHYISSATLGRMSPYFAYPFGHYCSYLTDEYLPSRGDELKLRAALTTEPRPLRWGENRWKLPRFTCGHHWTTPYELERILG
jgi:hypothetical protein